MVRSLGVEVVKYVVEPRVRKERRGAGTVEGVRRLIELQKCNYNSLIYALLDLV